jgi:hypothetical protein
MGIATSTVTHYVTDIMGMKYRRLQWMPHTLTPLQEAVRVDLARRMLLARATY